jgi:hypothetical protein
MSRGALFVHHRAARTTDWELEIVSRDGTPVKTIRGTFEEKFDEYFPLRMSGAMTGVAGPDTHHLSLEYCVQANYMRSVAHGSAELCAAKGTTTPPDRYIKRSYEITGTLSKAKPRTTDRDRPPDPTLTNRDANPDPNVDAYGFDAIALAGNVAAYDLVQEVPHARCRAAWHNQMGQPTVVELGPGTPGGDTGGGPGTPGGGNPRGATTPRDAHRNSDRTRPPVDLWPPGWPPWRTGGDR